MLLSGDFNSDADAAIALKIPVTACRAEVASFSPTIQPLAYGTHDRTGIVWLPIFHNARANDCETRTVSVDYIAYLQFQVVDGLGICHGHFRLR